MKPQPSDAVRPSSAMSYQELVQLGKATSDYENANRSMKDAIGLGGMALGAVGVNAVTGFNIQPHELQIVIDGALSSIIAVSGLNTYKYAKRRGAASNEINRLSRRRSS